jgi:glutathione peroxidase
MAFVRGSSGGFATGIGGFDTSRAPRVNGGMNLFRALAVAGLVLLAVVTSSAQEAKLHSIPLRDIDGRETSLKAHAGKVLLLVNVASQCGYMSQYEGLEALWQKYKDRGLVVLGIPSNDFGAQEPGSNAEIKEFCASRFGVTFPMSEKIHVKGPDQHPLYAELTGPGSPAKGPVKWNFGKFLIGRDGAILGRFDSDVEPGSPALTGAIEQALARKR